MMKPIVVAHAGVGTPNRHKDGPAKACRQALRFLGKGRSALDAIVAGAMVLEDDPRFNAGTGSYLRLDGVTIDMDASLMDSNSNFGSVIGIKNVKNPIQVVRQVIDSPHVMLYGDGATKFAYLMGIPEYIQRPTSNVKKMLLRARQRLKEGNPAYYARKWRNWKFRKTILKELGGTIGLVLFDGKKTFAAASSTGGTSYSLPGRVGDTPLIGCGVFAGPAGAVTATGVGEEIIKKTLSKEVYLKIAAGIPPQKACEWGVNLFDPRIPIGLLAVTREASGSAANQQMAKAVVPD
ncbi:MAG: isoaspartyl peptidase/L-asparaginase [Planctomycetota bacterium]